MVILDVRLEVLGQIVNALGEERHLNIGAARVFLVHLQRLEVRGFGHISNFVSRAVWVRIEEWQAEVPQVEKGRPERRLAPTFRREYTATSSTALPMKNLLAFFFSALL